MMAKKLAAKRLVLLAFLLTACQLVLVQDNESQAEATDWPLISQEEIIIPEGYFLPGTIWTLVWTQTDELLIFIDVSDGVYLLSDIGRFESVGLVQDEQECSRQTSYFNPEELPDRRIGWIKFCNSSLLENTDGEEGVWRELIAFDLQTKEDEQIVPGRLPRIRSYKFSWNPDFTKGIVSAGTSDGTLYWIDLRGSYPINLTIGTGEKSWNLTDSYYFEDADDNPEVGIASYADWSPDGRTIAFLASTDSVGKIGFEKSDSMLELYFLNPNSLEYRIVLSDVFPLPICSGPQQVMLLL